MLQAIQTKNGTGLEVTTMESIIMVLCGVFFGFISSMLLIPFLREIQEFVPKEGAPVVTEKWLPKAYDQFWFTLLLLGSVAIGFLIACIGGGFNYLLLGFFSMVASVFLFTFYVKFLQPIRPVFSGDYYSDIDYHFD